MKKLLALILSAGFLFLSSSVFAAIIIHESWETAVSGEPINDIGYYSQFRIRNNSCSGLGADLDDCGNTCGEPNSSSDACCRSNDSPWEPVANIPGDTIIENWSTGRFQDDNSWWWPNDQTQTSFHEVPTPVDGSWVARAYVPDITETSPYRCNDDTSPVRPRALVGASQSSDSMNSATLSRWYGVAVLIDPAWNLQDGDQYEGNTLMSQHVPNTYNGGGSVRINFQIGWENAQQWRILSSAEVPKVGEEACSVNTAALAACNGFDITETNTGKCMCSGRNMEILDTEGDPSGDNYFEFVDNTDKGHWVYWVIHTKGDPTGASNGILQVWVKRYNGSYWKVVDFTGQVGNMTSTAPYWKMGISDKTDGWDDGAVPKIIYYDNFRVGDENSNFDEVDPVTGPAFSGANLLQ